MRLIDADALYERTAEWEAQALHMVEVTMNDENQTEWQKWSTILTERSAFKYDIADAPTIEPEQPKIIRCEDCKYWDKFPSSTVAPAYHECNKGIVYHWYSTAEDYCSRGVRIGE